MDNERKKYSQKWNLTNMEKLASTFTSDIYQADSKHGKVVLKILNELGIKDELPGTYFLDNCQGRGCVNLYEFDEKALLIDYLEGENLYQFSKTGQEEQASKVFCEIIKKIHGVKVIKHIDKLNDFKILFDVFRKIKAPSDLLEIMDKGKHLSEKLLASQNIEVLLHGDLHHENIMSNSKGEFVCFDPKGFRGDPAYELGTTLKNPWDYPEISQDLELFQERAKFFSRELGLCFERVIEYAFVHICLSIAWALEDQCDYDHQAKIIRKINQII
jgi:streptomycin 6-kinase